MPCRTLWSYLAFSIRIPLPGLFRPRQVWHVKDTEERVRKNVWTPRAAPLRAAQGQATAGVVNRFFKDKRFFVD